MKNCATITLRLLLLVTLLYSTSLKSANNYGCFTSAQFATVDSLEDGVLRGVILDEQTGQPLSWTTIAAYRRGNLVRGTESDNTGRFTLKLDEQGISIRISHLGYQKKKVVLDAIDLAQELVIRLKPEAIEVPITLYAKKLRSHHGGPHGSPIYNSLLPILHYTHFNQFLRAKITGLVVSQAGNDPWEIPVLRYHGTHSLSQSNTPLFVLDGMPGVSPSQLDIGGLSYFMTQNRPLYLVQYGLLAGSGVFAAATRQYESRKLAIAYQGQVSHERPINLPNVASAEAFINNPGPLTQLGAATNWLDEVTRAAWSHRQFLSISGRHKNTQWRSEGAYRNVQGVGQKSAWQQYVGRLVLRQDLWGKKLQLTAQAAIKHRTGTRDHPLTFFHAASYNPTAPVFYESVPDNPQLQPFYQQNAARLRQYFELPVSDYFNPVAMQASSLLFQQRTYHWLYANSILRLSDLLSWRTSVGYQKQEEIWGEENRMFGLFRGNALTDLPGTAERTNHQQQQQWLRSELQFHRSIPKGSWNIRAAYSYQQRNISKQNTTAQGFVSDNFKYHNFENFLTPLSSQAHTAYSEVHRLIGFFGESRFSWRSLSWKAGINQQKTSRLGVNNPWFNNWGMELNLSLGKLVKLKDNNALFLRASFAQIGNLPLDNSYARSQFDPTQGIYLNTNPNLKAETRRISQAEFSWLPRNRIYTSLIYSNSRTSDLLMKTLQEDAAGNFSAIGVNLNQIALRNRSWQLTISLRPAGRCNWESSFHWAWTRTGLERTTETGADDFFDANGHYITNASTVNNNSAAHGLGLLETGAPLGQLIGRQFNRIESLNQGSPVYTEVFIGNNLPQPNTAWGVIGNGLPTHTYSWNNKYKWKRWTIELSIRGELGHDLANLLRLQLDPITQTTESSLSDRNYLRSKYDLFGVSGATTFSNRYVESADYLSVDYLRLSRFIKLKNGQHIILSASIQNLFLLTTYTGVDPSPRYIDSGPENNGSLPSLSVSEGQLAPGIDRRYFYPRSQTITLGVSWNG